MGIPGTLVMEERLEIALVREIERAYACGGAIPVIGHARPYQWANACHDLFEAGRIDILEFAVRALQARYPDITYLSTLFSWFDVMPRATPAALPFCDDPAAEVQVVRRADTDAVLICFCACRATLGLPLNFVHRWLGHLPVSLIYVKDFRELWGAAGFTPLGPDRTAAVKSLRRIAKEIGASRIYTFGVSRGGFPALYYGLKLKAYGALSLGGATDLTPAFVESSEGVSPDYARLCAAAPDYATNLRDVYRDAWRRPHALIAYGAGHPSDRRHAERMAGLRDVELVPIDYAQHNVIEPLIRSRQLMPLMERLLSSGGQRTSISSRLAQTVSGLLRSARPSAPRAS